MSIKQWIQKNNLLADLVAHLRTPLYRNGYALMMSTAATSGLGSNLLGDCGAGAINPTW